MSYTMISLTDILKRTSYSYDCGDLLDEASWLYLLSSKSYDKQTIAFVLYLLENPEHQLDPIGQSEDPWHDGQWCQSNGHHRLTAYILAGRDRIPVCDNEFMSWDDPTIRQDSLQHHARGGNLDLIERYAVTARDAIWVSEQLDQEVVT